ncbi:MAG: peptide chain release factor-like protein [Verrucomicrobiales bacterium]|nr:peptide chain release factor-like protein [Verrucomicrobiales bacterium]MCP5519853.1 peptide chain release factor-like protein [Verrucomicrobiales bacterium]MCP5527204.1 peptide chain release factor-like protein [Verrucomicrobiales bacterium]
MSEFPVPVDRASQIARRMARLGVGEEDLRESFVRSSGPGGQNVNKTATCVLLVHVRSGLQVKCQTSRQQGANRLHAREMLLDKLEELARVRRAERQAEAARRRYQKRKRSRAAKERMLADKARRSIKKEQRRQVRPE